MQKKIVIIGNGEIGQAMHYLLESDNHLIEVWDKDHAKNTSGKTIDNCLTDADFLFLCIPSWYMEEVLSEISLSLEPETVIVSLSKGLNAVSHQSMDELIRGYFKDNRFALLSGPMLAREIKEDKGASAIVAAKDKETYEEIAGLFSGLKFITGYSAEVHSVALAAVLKNIYTLLIGMLDGLGEGDNTKGFFMSLATCEIMEILEMLGADINSGLGIAGLGDFIATASSPYSQNSRAGEEIAKNGGPSGRSEGLVSLPSMIKLVGARAKDLPLLSMLGRIVIDNKKAKTEIESFLNHA